MVRKMKKTALAASRSFSTPPLASLALARKSLVSAVPARSSRAQSWPLPSKSSWWPFVSAASLLRLAPLPSVNFHHRGVVAVALAVVLHQAAAVAQDAAVGSNEVGVRVDFGLLN